MTDTLTIDIGGVTVTPSAPERKGRVPRELVIDGVAVEYFNASSRTVFQFDETRVLKVEVDDNQNRHEWQVWCWFVENAPEASRHLAKSYSFHEAVTNDGFNITFLLQERLPGESPRRDSEAYFAACDELRGVLDCSLCDNGVHQWKMDDQGVPRCHDYALWMN